MKCEDHVFLFAPRHFGRLRLQGHADHAEYDLNMTLNSFTSGSIYGWNFGGGKRECEPTRRLRLSHDAMSSISKPIWIELLWPAIPLQPNGLEKNM